MRITTAGSKALGPFDPLPTGDALREKVLAGTRLSSIEKNLFAAICDVYPDAIHRKDVLVRAKYAPGGGPNIAFAKLIDLDYVVNTGSGMLMAAEEMFG